MKNKFFYSEDFFAIIIGLFLLVAGFMVFINTQPKNVDKQPALESLIKKAEINTPFKSILWYQTYDELKAIKASKTRAGTFLSNLTTKPGGWKVFPMHSFYLSENDAITKNEKGLSTLNEKGDILESLLKDAQVSELDARSENFEDEVKNQVAIEAIDEWRKGKADFDAAEKKTKNKSFNKIPWILLFGLFLLLLFGFAARFIQGDFIKFAKGFLFVFFIGIVSYFFAGHADAKAIGFGYAAWAIIFGLLISNTIGTPKWVKPSLLTELYIKTGLVVLGAEILLGKILAIGLPGIFVAWIVTPIVLISTFWFGQKVLKIGSKTLNMTISADMSVCGVSAAVATAAACKATKEELTIAIGLSMVFTSIMMIVLPAFINAVGMPEILGGAWIGGTIDATGAVVAAGAFLGEKALSVAATIKMIQNVLIGIIAFGVAVYFSGKSENGERVKFSWREIWRRFPKFILGFLGASIVFSLIYQFLGENRAYTFIDQGVIGGFTKNIRGWLFCLAFVSIGLSINFKDLKKHFIGGKPFVLYICGQAFNLGLTLLMAYIMFYKIFPAITNSI